MNTDHQVAGEMTALPLFTEPQAELLNMEVTSRGKFKSCSFVFELCVFAKSNCPSRGRLGRQIINMGTQGTASNTTTLVVPDIRDDESFGELARKLSL